METKKQSKNIKGAGRPNGVPNKSTTKAREAIAAFVDGNAHLLQTWLEQVAMDERYGPKTAFDCFMAVAEYHVPKLARQEHVGADSGPIELVVKWQDERQSYPTHRAKHLSHFTTGHSVGLVLSLIDGQERLQRLLMILCVLL